MLARWQWERNGRASCAREKWSASKNVIQEHVDGDEANKTFTGDVAFDGFGGLSRAMGCLSAYLCAAVLLCEMGAV